MPYYAGLDVSLRFTNICVIDDDGEILAEGKTESEVADIVGYLDALKIKLTRIGLEAGTLTQYLTYGLQFAGFNVACMEARQVKAALSAMRNKTDKNDALAVETLQSIYDEVWGKDVFKCVGVDSRQVVYGGGNIHCITQQEPCA